MSMKTKMKIKQTREKLQKIVDEIRQKQGKDIIWLNKPQKGKGEKNISIGSKDKKGSLWIVPQSGYNICPVGKDWREDMYEFLRKLCGKDGRRVDGKLYWKVDNFEIVKKVVYKYAGVEKENMEIEFYPNDEDEFKKECAKSGKLLWLVYKGDSIFYHYKTETQGEFGSPLNTYLKTCQINSEKVSNIEGITKIRAFASEDFLENEGFKLEQILFSEDFYFSKILQLIEEFLKYNISDKKVKKIISFIKANTSLKETLDNFPNDQEFIKILAKIIAISDVKAADKNKYNPYSNNRAIGSGLRQPQWMKGFLEYKLNKEELADGVIKNLIDYVNDPIENISIVSDNTRNKISQQLLRKNYEDHNFIADLTKYFEKEKIYCNTSNINNKTIFIQEILYGTLKNKWDKTINMSEQLQQTINMSEQLQQTIDLLKYEHQIILQGSPGTGKTRFAKEIANQIAPNNYKLIQFHPAYSYEDFVRGIVAETGENGISYTVKNKVLAEMAKNAARKPDEDFVLIIDEINRANLSSVLGELIYALEYRDEAVESMYAIDKDREISLPKNLYIIGTMNTADRSVGHIDYAIRRRFAFVDINTDKDVIPKNAQPLFEKVKKLFTDNLSEEFEKNDVMIGHSYFLKDLKMALEYEIKPILQEYRKDGVLTCEKQDIDDLNVD